MSSKQVESELKACWCRSGTSALSVRANMDHGDFACRERGRYVFCSNCWTHGPTYTTDKEAVDGWNKFRTRVPVDSVAPRVDDADGSLRPEHKCKPLARALMMEGRDWWIGELLEPVSEWPHETHCLHMKTPLKVVSFLCNAGDFEQLLVLSNVVVRLENLSWLRAATASAKVRLLAPFSLGCHECGGGVGKGNDRLRY